LGARLANILLSYADAFGVAADHRLSYADLARHTASHRRSVISAMQELARRNLVKQTGEGWVIDAKRLLEVLLPGRLSLTSSIGDNKTNKTRG
jgi:hypothetical protein